MYKIVVYTDARGKAPLREYKDWKERNGGNG